MIDKFVRSVADAIGYVTDGSVVLVGGFGSVGQPNALIEGLIEQGAKDLTVVANNAGTGGAQSLGQRALGNDLELDLAGLVELLEHHRAGAARKTAQDSAHAAELHQFGQAGMTGAGIPAFFTPTAVGTRLAEGKEEREFNGRRYVMETALPGDLALVEAWRADRLGNLTYRESGRNFNPVMAMAGKVAVVQSQHIAEAGEIDPEIIVTPGIFVDRVVHLPVGDPVA